MGPSRKPTSGSSLETASPELQTTTPGEFAEVIALVRAGKTYVNVHSVKFGGGEIRSQINNNLGDRVEHQH